jgi:hypothetical protein
MSSGEAPDERELVKAFKPKVLLEGISVEHIKSLPKVRALLESIIEEEKKVAYAEGFEIGSVEGKQAAYLEARVDYDKDLLQHFKTNTDALDEILVALKNPIKQLQENIVVDLKSRFDEILSVVVSDTSIYDEKISESLGALVKDLPDNNNILKIFLKSKLNKKFLEYFSGFNVDVEVQDMDDLIRVETTCGDFRFSAMDYANSILNK